MPNGEQRLDLKAVTAKTQSGRDPSIEKKAMDYTKREWQMTVEPMLAALAADETVNITVRTACKSDEFISKVQHVMFEHKYHVLEKADDTKIELTKSGLLFPRKS